MKKLLIVFILLGTVSESLASEIQFKGDFRYRIENINDEGATMEKRDRDRIRARFGAHGKVNKNIDADIRLSTGGTSRIGTSANLGDAGANKTFELDLAYATWHIDSKAALTLGKMKNVFSNPAGSDLIFDTDLTPGGIAYQREVNKFNIEAAQYWTTENNNAADSKLYAIQVTRQLKPNKVKGGLGFFKYSNLEGMPVIDNVALGNSNNGVVYTNNYSLARIFLEFKHHLKGRLLTVAFDTLRNTSANSGNTAFLLGFKYGESKKIGDYTYLYNYRKAERDSILTATSDGNFGMGGTDAQGHKLKVSRHAADNMDIALIYFNGQTQLSSIEADYSKFLIDFNYTF